MTRARLAALVIAAAVCALISPWVLLGIAEREFLSTPPNGPETPAVPYERLQILSGDRRLDGFLVRAPSACGLRAAVLIFHGVKETISMWVGTQRFLSEHCVSSIVFDYSGGGDSTKPGNVKNINEDALATYSLFTQRFADADRRCVLGSSMGNAPMLESLASFRPAPSCVVVASAFSSLRDAASGGRPRAFRWLVPDVWDNVRAISRNRVPLLVVHSDADTVVPISMGKKIFDSAPEPKRMITLHGLKHTALYTAPSEEWLRPVLNFLRGKQAR